VVCMAFTSYIIYRSFSGTDGKVSKVRRTCDLLSVLCLVGAGTVYFQTV